MAVFTFLKVNGLPVAIPDATSASPNVPGLVTQTMNVFVTGTIEDVNFTITGLTHTWANDLDLALFGPNPNNNLILMSDAGGSSDFSNSTLTFDDSGTSSLLNNDTPISDGTYLPTNHSVATSGNINPVETTAQFGFISSTLNNPGPTGTSTFDSVFTGTDLNGRPSSPIFVSSP